MSDGDSLSEDAHALSDEEMVVRPGSNGPELARQYILATSQPPRTVFEGFFGRAAASVVRGRPAPCSRSPQSQPTQPAVAADGGRSRSPQSQSKPEERSPAHPLDQGLGGPPGASPVLDDPSGEDLEGTWVNGAGYLSYCRCIPGVHHTLPIPGEEPRRCFECPLPISPHGEPQGGERDEEDEASWVEWQRRLREERAQAAWQQWVDWKTNGTGIFTLELALPHLLRGALLIQGGGGTRQQASMWSCGACRTTRGRTQRRCRTTRGRLQRRSRSRATWTTTTRRLSLSGRPPPRPPCGESLTGSL